MKTTKICLAVLTLCFVFFSCGPDHFSNAQAYLLNKQFDSAIEELNQIKKGNRHFDEKDKLIQMAKDSAVSHYRGQIYFFINELKKDSALLALHDLKRYTSDPLISKDSITKTVEVRINKLKSDLTKSVRQKEYSDAIYITDILANSPELYEWAKNLKTKYEQLLSEKEFAENAPEREDKVRYLLTSRAFGERGRNIQFYGKLRTSIKISSPYCEKGWINFLEETGIDTVVHNLGYKKIVVSNGYQYWSIEW